MPGMSPEEMAQMQQQAQGAQGGEAEGAGQDAAGAASQVAQEVGQGLMKLAEMLDKSQAATDQDRQQMGQIISLFSDLVEKKLGGAPGEDQPSDEPMPSEVPAVGGMKGVPMGPQSRQ